MQGIEQNFDYLVDTAIRRVRQASRNNTYVHSANLAAAGLHQLGYERQAAQAFQIAQVPVGMSDFGIGTVGGTIKAITNPIDTVRGAYSAGHEAGTYLTSNTVGEVAADAASAASAYGSRLVASAAGIASGTPGSGHAFGYQSAEIASVVLPALKSAQTVSMLGRLGAAESGVWKLNPLERGRRIEQAFGHNLPGNFPTIDRFENGIATSIKSIDLDAAAYQSRFTLTRTLNGYVDKVADFQGRTWAGVRIRGQDITARALDLAIPHSGSAAQQAIIGQTVKYGASHGVTVNVITFSPMRWD